MIVSILFICISGKTHGHYGMILVPMYVYPLALVFGQIELICEKHGNMIVASLIAIYFIISIIMPSWNETIQDFPGLLLQEMRNSNQLMLPDNVRTICDYIINNTSEDDKISVYGNWDIIYVITNRCHATTYSYQLPIGRVKPEIMEDYFDQLARELPPVIVVQSEKLDERMQDFLEVNNYRNVWSENATEGAMLFAGN